VKNILIVDDDSELLSSMLRHFHRYRTELHVSVACDGSEALRRAAEQHIDVLVTDILMPRRDGLQTIRSFRKAHPAVRIIAMSGGGQWLGVECLVSARLMGAEVTHEKPFEFDVLLESIRSLLGQDSSTDVTAMGDTR